MSARGWTRRNCPRPLIPSQWSRRRMDIARVWHLAPIFFAVSRLNIDRRLPRTEIDLGLGKYDEETVGQKNGDRGEWTGPPRPGLDLRVVGLLAPIVRCAAVGDDEQLLLRRQRSRISRDLAATPRQGRCAASTSIGSCGTIGAWSRRSCSPCRTQNACTTYAAALRSRRFQGPCSISRTRRTISPPLRRPPVACPMRLRRHGTVHPLSICREVRRDHCPIAGGHREFTDLYRPLTAARRCRRRGRA